MSNEKIIDSVEALEEAIHSCKNAQKEFAKFNQEKVDEIFLLEHI